MPAALIALSRQILLFIPFLLVFPLFWGLPGIYAAAPASDVLTMLIALPLVLRQLRILRRREDDVPEAVP